MGTFEMSCEECSKAVSTAGATASVDSRYQREECIVALKVYDQCRQQSCNTICFNPRKPIGSYCVLIYNNVY